jgi:hypothetical protein
MVLNYHTYGNLLIYPWGYAQSSYTPDSAVFVEFAKVLTEQNNYTYGTGDQTVGYVTNGDSDDWQYAEQTTKGKSLSFTPEAGDNDDGFWPTINRIEPISKSNLRQNLNFAHLAGKYARTEDLSPSSIALLTTQIDFKIRRLGLDSPATFTVSLDPISTSIASVGTPKTFTNMTLLEERIDFIDLELTNGIGVGDKIKFLLNVDNGAYTVSDTITKTYGFGQTVFSDNLSSDTNWTASSSWALTTNDYYSAPSSYTDSPNGDHGNNVNNNIQLNDTIDLSNAIDARLNFWGRWELETGYDYAQVMASTDFGNTWVPLCGNYTKIGNSSQDEGNPVYNGFQFEWVEEEIDLSDFLGQQIQLRFKLRSDGFTTEDGYYFDDVSVRVIETSGTSTRDLIPNFNRAVYPNPNTGSFVFDGAKNGDILTITNNLGQIIESIVSTGSTIQFTDYKSGIYFIEVNSNSDKIQVIVK